jgi:hypothetical protein
MDCGITYADEAYGATLVELHPAPRICARDCARKRTTGHTFSRTRHRVSPQHRLFVGMALAGCGSRPGSRPLKTNQNRYDLFDVLQLFVHLQLNDGTGDLIIARSSDLELLSRSEGTAALESMMAANPALASELRRVVSVESEGAAVCTTEAGLSLARLVVFRIRGSTLTAADTQLLEEARQNRSTLAPSLPPRRQEPEVLRKYAIRVLDDTNTPVAGVQLKLDIQGTPKMPTTDKTGMAAAEWFSNVDASLRVVEQEQLEQMLKARWATPPSDKLPTGPNVHVLRVGSPFADLVAKVGAETTIIIARRELRIRVCDQDIEPHKQKRFVLEVDGHDPVEGLTDLDGIATVYVPEGATAGTIKVYPFPDSPDTFILWNLKFETEFKTAQTYAGASSRLKNLDYYFGDVVEEMTGELADAIRYFQQDWDLTINGELDSDTVKKLEEVHD